MGLGVEHKEGDYSPCQNKNGERNMVAVIATFEISIFFLIAIAVHQGTEREYQDKQGRGQGVYANNILHSLVSIENIECQRGESGRNEEQ